MTASTCSLIQTKLHRALLPVHLVPFLDLTESMDGDTKKKVSRRMVQTGVMTALILVLLGGFLMKLLHFSPGAGRFCV